MSQTVSTYTHDIPVNFRENSYQTNKTKRIMNKVLMLSEQSQFIYQLENIMEQVFGNELLIKHSENMNFMKGEQHRFQSKYYDLYLIDLNLPNKSALNTIYDLRRCDSDSCVIGIALFVNTAILFDALKTGIDGYIQLADGLEKVKKDIQYIISGQPNICPSIARKLLNQFATEKKIAPNTEYQLTQDEIALLKKISQGSLLNHSATSLNITVDEAYQHIKSAYRKLTLI